MSSLSKTTIVFIHDKKSSYMAPVVAQAKLSNPGAHIVIISVENARSFFERYGEFVDMMQYFDEAREFEKIYKHLSSMPYHLELIWLQRWFVLKAFMKDRNIERLVYLDSDCMLYTNVAMEWEKFQGYDFATLDILCPAVTYVTAQQSLDKFCTFVTEQYTIRLHEIEERYQKNFVERNLPGGIGDMSQFSMFAARYNSVYDLSRIADDNTAYDMSIQHSINTTRGADLKPLSHDEAGGYEIDDAKGIRRINIKGNMPYGILKTSGKKIQFKSLHFQGSAKRYIPTYFTGGFLQKYRYMRVARLEHEAQLKKQSASKASH